ncbi:EpsG family protein [Pedobacter sp. 22226]|uniref:EpsG family protein n=1 Tax=Pedobacter sp. 22226 TaxID=3453894 RepID=UPI003F86C1E2
MEVYFVYIGLLFLFSCFEVFKNKPANKVHNFLVFLTYLITVFVIGLRWETGTDWYPYLDMFEESYSLKNSFEYSNIVERGYLIFNWLNYKLISEYSFFLFTHALIFYYLIIYGLKKITTYPITSFMFFFCSTIGVLGSNRQLLAMAIVFYFLIFAYSKKKTFFIAIFAAIQFHTTALLTLSFYFLNRRIKVIYIVLLLLACTVIGLTGLPGKLFSLTGGLSEASSYRTEAYSAEAANEAKLSIAGVLRRLLYVTLFLLLRNKIEKKFDKYNFILNGYLISSLIYLLFASSLIILVNRGSLYFNMLECILFTSILFILKRKESKLFFIFFLLILSIVNFYQSISAYPDLFDPYKGLWYNIDYYRRMY